MRRNHKAARSRRLAPLLAVLACGCQAPAPGCLLASQKPVVLLRFFFGRDVSDGAAVGDAAWSEFVASAITPHFPDGFSVYDAYGQWRDPRTGRIGREASKVVEVAVPARSDVADRVTAVGDAYKARFRQEAVGVISTNACAAF